VCHGQPVRGLRPKVVLAVFKGNVRQSGGGGRGQRGQVGRARVLQGERFVACVVVIYRLSKAT